MKQWMFGLALAGVVAAPIAAHAEGLSYSYAEAGYLRAEADFGPVKPDGDGFYLGGSYEVVDNVHVVASVIDGSLSEGPASVDITHYEVGAGYHMPIDGVGMPLNVEATASYVKTDFDITGVGKTGDEGYAVDAGVRAMVTDAIEANAGHKWAHSDGGSDNTLRIGAVYYFTLQLGVAVNLSFADNVDMYGVRVRYNF